MKLLPACLLLTAGHVFAAGGTALDAFNFVTGARAGGMGGAATAVVVDPTALQWNPAGLARIPSFAATLSYLSWVAGIRYSYAGVSLPVPAGFVGLPVNGAAGASLQLLDYGTIESTRGLAAAVDARDLGFTAGAALRVADAISSGFALKYFGHALAGSSVSEAAVDAGAVYEAVPEMLSLALVVQNLGYSGALEGRRAPLPSAVKLGFAFGFGVTREPLPIEGEEPGWHPVIRMVTTGDVIAYQRGEPVNYTMGAEAGMNDLLFARIGYLNPVKAVGGGAGLSGGIGVKAFGVRLDYAYGALGDLGRAQYMTVSWSPAPRVTTAAPTAGTITPAATPTAPAPVAPPTADEAYRAGLDLYASKQYGEAARKAQAAVEADPGHWQAWQLLGNARFALSDRPGAVAAYVKSLEVHPDNPDLKAFLEQLKTP